MITNYKEIMKIDYKVIKQSSKEDINNTSLTLLNQTQLLKYISLVY